VANWQGTDSLGQHCSDRRRTRQWLSSNIVEEDDNWSNIDRNLHHDWLCDYANGCSSYSDFQHCGCYYHHDDSGAGYCGYYCVCTGGGGGGGTDYCCCCSDMNGVWDDGRDELELEPFALAHLSLLAH
jgi:hypothetical protein